MGAWWTLAFFSGAASLVFAFLTIRDSGWGQVAPSTRLPLHLTCGCAECDKAGVEVEPMDPPDCSCLGPDGEITC